MVLGGVPTSLEHGIVRDRFDEPRVHCALNCASRGCPRLPREALVPERLEAQLARETARFVAEARNVAPDPASGTVTLSRIFRWYEGDCAGWMRRHAAGEPPTALGWIRRHATPAQAAVLDARRGWTVAWARYGWRLNGRDGG